MTTSERVQTVPQRAAAPRATGASGARSAADGLTRLTPAQRQSYERDGFVVVPGVFAPAALEALAQESDRLITVPGVGAGPNRQGWIYDVARRSELTRTVAEDPRLLTLVEDVVRPGLAIHSSKLVTKLPHSRDICRVPTQVLVGLALSTADRLPVRGEDGALTSARHGMAAQDGPARRCPPVGGW